MGLVRVSGCGFMVVVVALEADFLDLFAVYCMRFGSVGFGALRWF